jgi:uncharacterized FAD-dependent dehydrogenase
MTANQQRATMGAAAVQHGSERDVPADEVVDTVANILHYAAQLGLDVRMILRIAQTHYENEVPETSGSASVEMISADACICEPGRRREDCWAHMPSTH